MSVCKICGKSFKHLGKHIRTHNIISEEYFLKFIGDKTYCSICGKETSFHTLKNGYKKFCSKECNTENQKGKKFRRKKPIKIKCRQCEKVFEVCPSNKNRKYCSRKCCDNHRKLLAQGKNNPFFGKTHNNKTRNIISKQTKKMWADDLYRINHSGKNSIFWKGGVSFEPYGLEFDKELKKEIRKKDNYTCQECGYSEDNLGYRLSIHHIDYNKQNNNKNNLISLCKSCHSKTNFDRKDWEQYFTKKTYDIYKTN